jgi:hypothetical protein
VSRKNKTPVISGKIPNPKREPRVEADGENSASSYPIWRVFLMDTNGPWHWDLSPAKLHEIRQKLGEFEGMRWGDIAGRRHHFLSPDSLSTAARKRLQELKQDDADDLLFSLAFSNLERLVGIRAGREFRLLWWDPNHEVSPSPR